MATRQLTPEDYIAILRRRWLLIVILAVLGGGLGVGVTYVVPKRFTSQTQVLVSAPTVSGDYVKAAVSQETNQRLSAMQQLILSPSRLEPIIRQLGLYGDEINQVPMEDLVKRLQKAITVTPIAPMAETRSQGLPGFTVSVNYSDARLAQQICSTITSIFMEEDGKFRQAQAEQTTQFLGGQLDDAKTKLDEQDARLAAFKRRYLGSLPDQAQTNLNLLTGLNSQLDAATQGLTRAQQDKAFATSMLVQQEADWQAVQQAAQANADGKSPETTAAQITALETQLTSLKAKYTDNYPDVIKLKNDIDALKKKKAEAEELAKTADKPNKPVVEPPQIQTFRAQVHQYDDNIKEMTARQEAITQQIKLYQDRVQSSPGVEQEYKGLTRDYQTALDFYNDLLKKRNESAMATDLERKQQGEQFQLLDAANFPNTPAFPKKSYFGLGGFGGGLVLGLGIGMLLELQDTSVRSEKEVEFLLHLPVLATIPTLKPPSGKPSRDPSVRLAMRA
jgi:polysaccharide chain length determinant protein (PEP-CTERM system associated)